MLGTPPPPRAWHTAATVGGNKIVIAGGVLEDGMTDEDRIYVLDCGTIILSADPRQLYLTPLRLYRGLKLEN